MLESEVCVHVARRRGVCECVWLAINTSVHRNLSCNKHIFSVLELIFIAGPGTYD